MTDNMTFLVVYENDGTSHVHPSCEPRINAAVERYVTSGCNVDTLLDLELLDGSTYWVKTSIIEGWTISTPEYRRYNFQHNHRLDQEVKSAKAEVNVWDDE